MPSLSLEDSLEFPFEVEFTYYPAEPGTRDYPGESPFIEITSVRLFGQPKFELIDWLSSRHLDAIEHHCWEKIHSDEDAAIISRAEALEDSYLEPISMRDYDIS